MNETNESKQGGSGNRKVWAIWVVLAVAVAAVVVAKLSRQGSVACSGGVCPMSAAPAATNAVRVVSVPATANLPRLVDLGAGKCIPCKMMAPILEELKKTFAGKLDVQFIDVWVNPDEGPKYGIKIIPTQIFYDAGGKELFRHEGFFSREDILAKWKEFGVDLGAAGVAAGASH